MNYVKQFFINLVQKLQNNNPYFVKMEFITVYHAVPFFHFKISLMMNLHLKILQVKTIIVASTHIF